LLAALRLSGVDALRELVADLLAAAGLPTTMGADIDPEAVVAATLLDKKRVGTRVPFVLVRSPGDVVFGQRVDSADVLAAVAELQR
jgi:shikimate kinase/3-dehydroquinate synthase